MAKLNQQDIAAIQGAVTRAIEEHQEVEIQAVAQIVVDCYKGMMEQEAREIARVHGQMLETAAMIEEVAAREELDISALGDEANKRAYALAVAMAERAVAHAESVLIDIKEMIDQAQIGMAKGGMHLGSRWLGESEWKNRLERLVQYEKKANERLEVERKRLTSLKLESRGLRILPGQAQLPNRPSLRR